MFEMVGRWQSLWLTCELMRRFLWVASTSRVNGRSRYVKGGAASLWRFHKPNEFAFFQKRAAAVTISGFSETLFFFFFIDKCQAGNVGFEARKLSLASNRAFVVVLCFDVVLQEDPLHRTRDKKWLTRTQSFGDFGFGLLPVSTYESFW